MESYLPHVGHVQFPRGPHDLTSAVCPACFAPRTAVVCPVCGLDLGNPALADLDRASMDASAALDRRLELIGRIRFETAAAAAVVEGPTQVPVAAPALVAPTAVAAPAGAPTPTSATAPPAEPRRHLGVQVILLIVGVSLLAVGAVFFLVYAFITFGLVWRSIIIATVTVAAFLGASLLKRRRLPAGAEAIAALAAVLVYLDAFAVRANDLFGAGGADESIYWGVALVLSAVGFAVWHRFSAIRLPNVVAFLAFAPGVALLAAGLGEPLEPSLRVFVFFAGLAVGGLVHRIARTRVERISAASLAVLGLLGAGLSSLAIVPAQHWAPLGGLLAVSGLAALHAVLALRRSRGLAIVFSTLSAIAASVALLPVALRDDDPAFLLTAPVLAAAALALALEAVHHRVTPTPGRTVLRAAVVSAAAVAGLLTLLPLGTALSGSLRFTSEGSGRWSIGGGTQLPITVEFAASVLALVAVVALAAVSWSVAGTLRGRLPALISAIAALGLLAPPLLGIRWAVVLAWLIVAALGVALLIWARSRTWSIPVRVPIVVGSALALLAAYVSSWASIDTWWYASVGAVALLVVARLATDNPWVRAGLVSLSIVIAFVAVGSEGWHVNERFRDGAAAPLESLHFVVALAILLIGLAAVLSRGALGVLETRVLYWSALATAVVAAGASWRLGAASSRSELSGLVLPEFTTSLLLACGLGAALGLWLAIRSTRALLPERAAASIVVAPAVAWGLDALTRVLGVSDYLTSLAPVAGALLVAGGCVALAILRPTGQRWAREVGVAAVAIPAIVLAMALPHDATWLVLIVGAVTALLLAVSSDGLFASASPRKHLGWVALALSIGGLWWRLGEQDVTALEPYVLPLAGALLVIALLVWRAARPAPVPAAAFIALGALLVAIVPLAVQGAPDGGPQAIVVAAISGGLLLAGSLLRGSSALAPYLDVAALAGAIGVGVAGFGRAIVMSAQRDVHDLTLDAWLAASFALLLLAAAGQARLAGVDRGSSRAIAGQVLGGTAMLAVTLVELSVLDDTALGAGRAIAVIVVLALIHVVSLLVDRPPFTTLVGWGAIALAAVAAITAVVVGALDPLEWASAPIALALLTVGAVRLRRDGSAGSWPWLAPGVLVLLLPSLGATFADQPVWRLVALGAVGVAVVLVGALGKLQAPLILGAVIVLVHAVRTFAPQLVAVYQLTEWWVWAVIGGAIIVFVAVTFEKRVRDLRAVGSRISSLR